MSRTSFPAHSASGPVARLIRSVRRKLSGSLPGCRFTTQTARRIASATASASSWSTDVSFAMGIPFRSQSIPNTNALANSEKTVTPGASGLS
jgi:hypothetical protein